MGNSEDICSTEFFSVCPSSDLAFQQCKDPILTSVSLLSPNKTKECEDLRSDNNQRECTSVCWVSDSLKFNLLVSVDY